MLIGSQVSMAGEEMLLGACKQAIVNGANCFMVYSGPPQNARRKDLADMRIEQGHALMKEKGIKELVVHAPYIINLANIYKTDQFRFGIEFMKDEIKRADALKAKQLCFHPGAHVGAEPKKAIQHLAKGLNAILDPSQNVQLSLETMAGKGTELGRNFEELAAIIEQVELKDKLSVTLDSCHCHDAGYEIRSHFDQVLEEFDQVVGLKYLKVIHLNDSKNECGSHKDRHENIGFGQIGFDALNYIAHHPRLKAVPKILETPFVNQQALDSDEIQMLKQQSFNPQLKESINHGL